MNKIACLTLSTAVVSLTHATIAWTVGPSGDAPTETQSIVLAQAIEAMTDGEVRKIDKEAKKVTIRHSEIKNLNMPAMTMVFQVKDPSILDRVKQGDKVRFFVEQSNGSMVVSRIEPAK